MLNIDSDTLHWLAGLLEGEAYFNKPLPSNPNLRRVTLTMTDEDVIARVSQIFSLSYTYVPPYKVHWKPSYKFSLIGKRARELMALIYPLMGLRRQRKITYLLESYVPPSKHHSQAKLTEDEVREIKRRIANKEKARLIAEDYDVTIFTIREISQGKIWKHVTLDGVISRDEPPPPKIIYDLKSIHWLAGLIEGEGSFCAPPPSSPNHPYANLAMTDEDVVARAAEIIGVSYSHVPARHERAKDSFQLRAKGARGVNLMRELYPLMGERRKRQIDHALEDYVEITDGKGENHSQAKLTTAQVIDIKRKLADGIKTKTLAREYNVSYYTIHDIKRGRHWSHITLDPD